MPQIIMRRRRVPRFDLQYRECVSADYHRTAHNFKPIATISLGMIFGLGLRRSGPDKWREGFPPQCPIGCLVDTGACDIFLPFSPYDEHLRAHGIELEENIDREKGQEFGTADKDRSIWGYPLREGLFVRISVGGINLLPSASPFFSNQIDEGVLGRRPLLRSYALAFEKDEFHILFH